MTYTHADFLPTPGDSGGPLFNYATLDGKLKAVQMGIVASGHSDCGRGIQNYPGIYTDVNFYMDWILDNIEE
jgi:secreted trypsin-like serine protease